MELLFQIPSFQVISFDLLCTLNLLVCLSNCLWECLISSEVVHIHLGFETANAKSILWSNSLQPYFPSHASLSNWCLEYLPSKTCFFSKDHRTNSLNHWIHFQLPSIVLFIKPLLHSNPDFLSLWSNLVFKALQTPSSVSQ